jgi:hypothetical protein
VVLVMGGGDGMGKLEAITQTLPAHLVRAGATFIFYFSFSHIFLNANFHQILINTKIPLIAQ